MIVMLIHTKERVNFYSDLNNDSKDDIIFQLDVVNEGIGVETFFACFIFSERSYEIADEIVYHGSDLNVPGYYNGIELKSAKRNEILATVHRRGINDGASCPSIQEEVKFEFKNNKLLPLEPYPI